MLRLTSLTLIAILAAPMSSAQMTTTGMPKAIKDGKISFEGVVTTVPDLEGERETASQFARMGYSYESERSFYIRSGDGIEYRCRGARYSELEIGDKLKVEGQATHTDYGGKARVSYT